MNVVCSTGCKFTLDSYCVFYEGESLLYTGIVTNDNLQTALQKIDQTFQNASVGYAFVNGTTLISGNQVGLGGSLIQNTLITGNYNLTFEGELEAASFVTAGGTSSQFVKGDGSLDSTSYQPFGNYITTLTGDGTASGPGSAVLTLANVFGAPGTYGNSTTVPTITVDGKGRITNITNSVINLPSDSLSFQGDVTGIGVTGAPVTLTLDTVNSNIFVSDTPLKFSVNGKGLVTSAALITNLDLDAIYGYTPVPTTRTLTINGVTQNLANNRSWTIAGTGHIIQYNGTPVTNRTNLNFTGPGVVVTDDSGNDATVVTISGGGSSFINSISDTNTVNLTVTVDDLTADVRYQNTATILLSENASGLKADFTSLNISQFTNDSGYLTSLSLQDLTVSTGLQLNSGTTYNTSAARTISIDNTVVTLTGAQALSNKTGNISQWTNDSNYITLGSVLTGLSISGSTITGANTVLQAFGALQNQINGLIGGVIYQGTWNATTNTPTLVSSTGTKGYYYIVDVAGSTNLDGITDWKIGDWVIFNGTVWEKVDNTDAVTSINGAIGGVVITTTGTVNRISVTGGSGLTPTIDISSSYVGQSSITTLGTITTGTWNGSLIGTLYGGTGLNTSSSTGVAQVSAGTWSISPTLANNTLATTQIANDNSTKVATTAYVDSAVSSGSFWRLSSGGILTGDNTISGNFNKYFTGTGVFVIGGNSGTAKFRVIGNGTTTGELVRFDDNTPTNRFLLLENGALTLTGASGVRPLSIVATAEIGLRLSNTGSFASIQVDGAQSILNGQTSSAGVTNSRGYFTNRIDGGLGGNIIGNLWNIVPNSNTTVNTALVEEFAIKPGDGSSAVIGGNYRYVVFENTATPLMTTGFDWATFNSSGTGTLTTRMRLRGSQLAIGADFTPTSTLHVRGSGTTTNSAFLIEDSAGSDKFEILDNGNTTLNGDFTLGDAKNLIFNTTVGTKIGTATTQKIGFWNSTPVVQPTGWGTPTGTLARTTFDESTVTLTELAQRLAALITDLKSLGLIGT